MAKTAAVLPDRRNRVLLALTLALTASACSKNSEAAEPAPPAAPKPSTPAPAPQPAAAPASGAQVLSGIPGMDFSALPPAAQRELSTVFTDEFCYCGCPHTLGQCLKGHTTCSHAKRMARLAARHASAGVPATDIIVALSEYYSSFRAHRQTFEVDPRMCMGDAKAPVTLVEFFDFECPYCGKARPLIEAFAKKNPSKLRFCAVPFPLPMHPNAIPAGQAAMWARDQGKYWEMHDALFENAQSLSPAKIVELANKLGLKGAELQKTLQAGTYAQEVEKYKSMGNAANIHGTPSLFFNGRSYSAEMGLTDDALSHTLEDEIEWRSNGNAWAAD
ncbi:thioredoxin domain-containing protein [Vitiosangium sp. GDMCC 1.1324]|uniref:DsbA family protein n=1 Tax=Vitiosangium sp. (strain GDMCC 1.1324) TaxID=2138576 RepID=UPI000D359FBD|nr:thioredoxin domain-containing protein [Vitiosangium sp. GDMCC 1.1324]PTL78685.1 thioredoxin [Vitiosangium sp. GDMCC 1.1324]